MTKQRLRMLWQSHGSVRPEIDAMLNAELQRHDQVMENLTKYAMEQNCRSDDHDQDSST